MTTKQLEKWTGEFGDQYLDRNLLDDQNIMQRTNLWNILLMHIAYKLPERILEIGAGAGGNLIAINNVYNNIGKEVNLYAIEPNTKARDKLREVHGLNIFNGSLPNTELDRHSFDLVFTSGVLIHIHPGDLVNAMKEIYRVSKRYIISIEYFSPNCTETEYRGEDNLLWSNDFGAIWLDNFPLRCVGYGFSWKKMSGLDNLTWWIFEKVN